MRRPPPRCRTSAAIAHVEIACASPHWKQTEIVGHAAVDEHDSPAKALEREGEHSVRDITVHRDAKKVIANFELYALVVLNCAKPSLHCAVGVIRKPLILPDPPSGLLITSDGKIVTVSNSRLRTNTQRYSFGATPLSLFLGRQIRLDRGVAVTSVVRQPGGFTIVVRDARGQAEGSVALEFADNPMRLRGWTLTDAQRHATTVKITELEPVGALPDSLFQQPTSPTR